MIFQRILSKRKKTAYNRNIYIETKIKELKILQKNTASDPVLSLLSRKHDR